MGGACCNNRTYEEKTKTHQTFLKVIETSKGMDEFKKDYEYISILGNGAYGTVKLYRSSKNHTLKYAVKSVNKQNLDLDNTKLLQNEVKILRNLDHPNIVKFYDTFENEQMFNIVMEFIPGDNLTKLANKQKSKSFTEKDTSKIFLCLFKTVLYLHNNRIVHRDIKPSNILFKQPNDFESLKLIDFGISIFLDEKEEEEEESIELHKTTSKRNNRIRLSYKDVYGKENYQYKNQIGTPYYMSPESIKGQPCEKSDCWAIGVLLYQTLTGSLPFRGDRKEKIFDEICNCRYDTTALKQYFSVEVQDLIMKLLTPDLEIRLSAKEALTHPWFQVFKNSAGTMIDKEVLNNIMHFHEKNVFQKEVSFFLAKLSSSSQLNKLDKIFKELDVNNTGYLDFDGLCQGLRNIGLEEVSYMKSLLYCIIIIIIVYLYLIINLTGGNFKNSQIIRLS